MIEVDNEQHAIDMILLGIPGIWEIRDDLYIVQRNGQQGEFESALEAINFYNSTYEKS